MLDAKMTAVREEASEVTSLGLFSTNRDLGAMRGVTGNRSAAERPSLVCSVVSRPHEPLTIAESDTWSGIAHHKATTACVQELQVMLFEALHLADFLSKVLQYLSVKNFREFNWGYGMPFDIKWVQAGRLRSTPAAHWLSNYAAFDTPFRYCPCPNRSA
jgi:hypothetical protein